MITVNMEDTISTLKTSKNNGTNAKRKNSATFSWQNYEHRLLIVSHQLTHTNTLRISKTLLLGVRRLLLLRTESVVFGAGIVINDDICISSGATIHFDADSLKSINSKYPISCALRPAMYSTSCPQMAGFSLWEWTVSGNLLQKSRSKS